MPERVEVTDEWIESRVMGPGWLSRRDQARLEKSVKYETLFRLCKQGGYNPEDARIMALHLRALNRE